MLLPMLAAALAYANTLDAGFVYDDTSQIQENPWVKDLRFLPQAISKPVWAFKHTQPTNYYRPVQMGLYNLMWAASGGRPGLFHAVNVLLHVLNTGLAALLVLRLSRSAALAGTVALLFAVNPVNTESVAWVACLPELTYALFLLGALLVHVASWDERSRARRWLRAAAPVLFALAVLSKETAVVLVGLVFVLELAVRPSRPEGAGALRERLPGAVRAVVPYVLIVLLYAVARWQVVGGVAPLSRPGLTPLDALINAPVLLLSYVEAIAAPVRQVAFHVFHPLPSVFEPAFAAGLAATFVIVGLGLRLAPRRGDLAFAGALFLFPLLPVLYVPAVGSNAFAERYAYVPSIGIAWWLMAGLMRLARGWGRGPVPERAAVAVALLIAVPLAARTVARNREWHDNARLAASMIRDEPGAEIGHVMLGNVYLAQGGAEQALVTFENGRRHVPDSVVLEANAIGLLLQLRRIDVGDAIGRLRRAAATHPTDVPVWLGLGYAQLQAGRWDEALASFEQALEILPIADAALLAMAVIEAKKGNDAEAIELCRRAIAIDPLSAAAHQQMGVSLLRSGRIPEAVAALETAVSLRPEDPAPWNALGAAYFGAGRPEDARRAWNRALALDPSHAGARDNLMRLRQSATETESP